MNLFFRCRLPAVEPRVPEGQNKNEIKATIISSARSTGQHRKLFDGETGTGAWAGIRKSKFSGASGIGLYAHGRSQWQRQHSCTYRNQQLAKIGCAQQPFMERSIDCKAGYKHHVTNEYLKHLQKSLMDLCNREFLHQVDLLSPSRTGVTEAEYWAQRRLNEKKREVEKDGLRQIRQSFKHRNSLSGMPLPSPVRKQSRMKIFKTSCRMNIIFLSKHNVVVIAICRRNGTSSYRSVLWEKAAKENVWKDSLFRTPRRICGTRKIPY